MAVLGLLVAGLGLWMFLGGLFQAGALTMLGGAVLQTVLNSFGVPS